MKRPLFILSLLYGAASVASGATFMTPVSITSPNSTPFFPIANLFQGPGVGYAATAPHNSLGGGNGFTWVTTDVPFPQDYYATMPAPILLIDLGANQLLTEISTWGYTTSNANGVQTFSLRFATAAEGTAGFGTSIANQGPFTAALSDITRDSHPLTAVTARYVEFTATDNYWANAGQGPPPGGDRVGLGEIAFAVVPEPSIALLSAFAGFGLIRRRRS